VADQHGRDQPARALEQLDDALVTWRLAACELLAIDASQRVIKLAPGTQEARQARQLIQLIKAQAAAQPSG